MPLTYLYTTVDISVYTSEFSNCIENFWGSIDFASASWDGKISLENNDDDGDGLTNGDELCIYFTNPDSLDSDSDGLHDDVEILIGSNPNTNDSDHDGLMDWDELFLYGTTPTLEDTDSDGINDWEEIFLYGTSPTMGDTDSDGLNDSVELIYGLNPLCMDSDNDNLLDNFELKIGTDPLDDDSDDDGFYDGIEIEMGKNPLDFNSYPGDEQTSTTTPTVPSTTDEELPWDNFLANFPRYSILLLLFSGIFALFVLMKQLNKKHRGG